MPRFRLWTGEPPVDSYGGKPILHGSGGPAFAELVVLDLFREAVSDGVWVDTYCNRLRNSYWGDGRSVTLSTFPTGVLARLFERRGQGRRAHGSSSSEAGPMSSLPNASARAMTRSCRGRQHSSTPLCASNSRCSHSLLWNGPRARPIAFIDTIGGSVEESRAENSAARDRRCRLTGAATNRRALLGGGGAAARFPSAAIEPIRQAASQTRL